MFYLNSFLNFGIPPSLVFQPEVYYKVDNRKELKWILKLNKKNSLFRKIPSCTLFEDNIIISNFSMQIETWQIVVKY